MRTLLIFTLLCVGSASYAQSMISLQYTYDNAGNRISRQIVPTSQKRDASDTTTTQQQIPKTDEVRKHDGLSNAGQITAYPNPVYQTLKIRIIDNAEDFNVQYTLTDLYGKIVYSGHSNKNELEIDCTTIASGVYFLRVKSNNVDAIHKINKLQQ